MPLSARGAKCILASSLMIIGCSPPANPVEASSLVGPEDRTVKALTGTACKEDERAYFSCETQFAGKVSVCGRRTDNILSLTYNYNDGNNTIIEHQWDTGSNAEGKFTKNSYHRYRTEYNEIGFALEDKEYKIFSHYDGEDGSDTFSRGVRIQNLESGDEIDSILCVNTQADDIKQLLPDLDCDRDSALGCAD